MVYGEKSASEGGRTTEKCRAEKIIRRLRRDQVLPTAAVCVHVRPYPSLTPPSQTQSAPAGSLMGKPGPIWVSSCCPLCLESKPEELQPDTLEHNIIEPLLFLALFFAEIISQLPLRYLIFISLYILLHVSMTYLLEVTAGKHKPS